jgi:hypothetical protein
MTRLLETDFQTQIVALAKLCGWLVHHTRPARTAKGWRTPIMGDAGFPDLVLAHPGRRVVIVAELKRDGERPTGQQERWHDALSGSVTVKLWTPADWGEIEDLLTGRR